MKLVYRCLLVVVAALPSLIGFVGQNGYITWTFYHWPTHPDTVKISPSHLPIPSSSYCGRFSDLLNRVLGQKYGLSSKMPPDETERLIEMGTLTVAQINELTPSVDQVMRGCLIRNLSTYGMVSFSYQINVTLCDE